MKLIHSLVLAATTAVMATPALAQFAKPEDALDYRQGAMAIMGHHAGRLGAMANGRVPIDAKVAAEQAEILATVARLPWAAFVPGSDKVGNTKAKPEIWAEQPKFREAADKMMGETTKLAAAAKSGNVDAFKTAFGATAASCKACHDSYRAK